jgi:hypothetical protein
MRCDGTVQCPDQSDEQNCQRKCQSTDHICGDGTCLPQYQICNGKVDCLDGSDENQDTCIIKQILDIIIFNTSQN